MQNSLRVRLTIILIGLAIGPLLLVGIILAQRSFIVEEAQALDLQRQVAQRAAAELDAFLREVGNNVDLLVGEMRNLGEPDRAQQLSLLLGALTSGPYQDIYEEFALLDGQGQEQLRLSRQQIIPTNELVDRSGATEYQQPRATGRTYFSPVWFDETGNAFITIAIPFSELRSVELKGVLVTNIRFKPAGDLLAGLQAGAGQTLYIVDPNEQVVAHQDPSIQLKGLRFAAPELADRQPGLEGVDAVLATDMIQFGDQELTVVAERPASDALASAFDTVYTVVLTIVIVLVIASGLGFLFVWQIVRPVEAMSATAQAISAGDLSQQVNVTSRDEIGTLAGAFNTMTTRLRELIDTLELRVAERTQRLEVVATLGERLSAILNVDQLLGELVNQVKERFGYYHAHVYLIDDRLQTLVMTVGAGEAGAQMKAQGHQIALDAPTSLVARAARAGQIVQIDNVRAAIDWLPNPLLPDTRSEMAVPIVLEGTVVGVLDVQQDRVAGLDENDANLLRSLASQVAIAIRNARLFAETEGKLAEARAIQEQYVEQAWDQSRIIRQNKGHVQYSLGTPFTLDEVMISQARQYAFATAEPASVILNDHQAAGSNDQAEASAHHALVAPIKLRNIVVGNLQLHTNDLNRSWTEDELALVNAVVDQVVQTAEAIRLLNETQERAARERLIGQISDKFRRASDLETLLKVGVEEISRVLRPNHAFIRLGSETELGKREAEKVDTPESKESGSEVTLSTAESKLDNPRNGHGDK